MTDIPGTCLGTLESSASLPELTDSDITSTLQNPVWAKTGGPNVFKTVKPGEQVCFVVSDHTRKTSVDRVLPPVIKGLLGKGCSCDNMKILIACGIHRPPTPDELAKILGDCLVNLLGESVHCHDADDSRMMVPVGTIDGGHTVRLNRHAVEADKLVLFGAASYHYHAGFGGGRKSLVPGIADRETIAHTHSLTLDPDADQIHPCVEIGRLDGNPVAETIMAAAQLHPADIIINTVLSPDGKLIGIFSGDMDLAHRQACLMVERSCRVDLHQQADFVIASAEDAPNWIQSHKALFNASRTVKSDGTIILTAPCPEGLGNDRFRYWLKKPSTKEIFAELRTSVEVNGQTALSTKIRGQQTILITDLNEDDRAVLGIRTAPNLDAAIQIIFNGERRTEHGDTTYYLMPHARHTVPFGAQVLPHQ